MFVPDFTLTCTDTFSFQRAGQTGVSYTYFTTENARQARELIGILRESKSEIPPQLQEMAMYSGGGGGRSMSLNSV